MQKEVRSKELAVAQISALSQALNAKISYPKVVMVTENKKNVERVTGSFEVTPFSEKEVSYLKACILSLTNQYVDYGDLVKEVKEEDKDINQLEIPLNE